MHSCLHLGDNDVPRRAYMIACDNIDVYLLLLRSLPHPLFLFLFPKHILTRTSFELQACARRGPFSPSPLQWHQNASSEAPQASRAMLISRNRDALKCRPADGKAHSHPRRHGCAQAQTTAVAAWETTQAITALNDNRLEPWIMDRNTSSAGAQACARRGPFSPSASMSLWYSRA